MGSGWLIAANSNIPLHDDLPPVDELPWTISYVIRKRVQLDSYRELPQEKRPPDELIWYGNAEEIDTWFDKVFKRKAGQDDKFTLVVDESEIE